LGFENSLVLEFVEKVIEDTQNGPYKNLGCFISGAFNVGCHGLEYMPTGEANQFQGRREDPYP